jgi:hypothetical protein
MNQTLAEDIIRIVNPNTCYSFNFKLSVQAFETFYFKRMEFFGLASGAIVAVFPVEKFVEDTALLVWHNESFLLGKVEYDEPFQIFFIRDETGFPVPLDTENVVGEPTGYCPLKSLRSVRRIAFKRLEETK